MSNKRDFIIIGGGPGGIVTAHVIKFMTQMMGKQLSVLIIKDEEKLVNRCAIPYGMGEKIPADDFLIPLEMFTSAAELKIDTVTKILPEESKVVTKSGEEFEYTNLLIATGASPFVPPIDLIDSKNILKVRDYENFEKMRELTKNAEKKKVVVIGGGYIGIEMACGYADIGFDVTVVEMLSHVMQITTDSEFTEIIEKELTDHKINLKLGQKLTGFVKSEKNPDYVSHVILDSGEKIEADIVVLSIGVRPNTKLAADCGIEVSKFGIVTNEHLQTKYPNIYAVGDATQKKSLITQKPTVCQFGTTAIFMGKVVANNILGIKKECKGVINSYCTKIFDWGIGGAGVSEEQAKAEGFDYVVGFSKVEDKYPMLNPSPLITKLVFNKKDMKLIGGCSMKKGDSAAHLSDWFSLGMQKGITLEDVIDFQYSTHPELNSKPSFNMYVAAAQDAWMKLQKK
ncbi:NADH oxidase [Anaeramoeba ignava]|uniref:NADH oxidase n=1 Tax=Anaeramoeba ignava TaxID=1746090 RepID=A0A9Q0R4P7_ANAIG|nr:NADH oxidase [Anaeramoeba ignava]|eukprot:Anaeramoba_ignava/a217483_797.p1 GENE.a217483_797~~a217483_797.p1  ORF type:complete len:455 (-),score=162.54 a217483_797:175-1539(-)